MPTPISRARGDGWRVMSTPSAYHVPGTLKCYSLACFQAVGGVQERLAWDTIDETYARMRGYRTRSYPNLIARHHRPWGSADGTLRGRARHGECAYIVHFTLAVGDPAGIQGRARSAPRSLWPGIPLRLPEIIGSRCFAGGRSGVSAVRSARASGASARRARPCETRHLSPPFASANVIVFRLSSRKLPSHVVRDSLKEPPATL